MRHTVIGLLAACAILACAAAAQAQTASPPADVPAAAPAPAEDKMICLDESAGGNSRLGTHKVCHTQKEWDSLPRARR
jgi:predicted secreted protein